MDSRLEGLAKKHNFSYTRYADDLTFSSLNDSSKKARFIISQVKRVLLDYGYQLNHKKTKIIRQNVRMRVTGLVVNQKVQLPRETRRWLRAVNHRKSIGKPITISDEQLSGWKNLVNMIKNQSFS